MNPSSALPLSDDLKPCPFCGDSGNPVVETEWNQPAYRFYYIAHCLKCCVRTMAHTSQQDPEVVVLEFEVEKGL